MCVCGVVRCIVGSSIVEDESWKVHCKKAIQADDSGLACAEGEYHVPNGGGVEGCKPGAQASWSPVEDWDCDDVRQAAKSAEKEANVLVKSSILDL